MTLRVRNAVADDIPAILQIERDSPTAGHWREQAYHAVFEEGQVPFRLLLVAEEDGVQGFLAATQVDEEWELENIVVSPEVRRRGIGAILLKALLERARQENGQVVFLEVRESSAAPRRFYEKSGFVETGRRRGYYSSPPEDAITYQRKLP